MSSSRDLQVLRAIAEALNGAGDVDAALQTTLEQVAVLLGLETGWIWLSDTRTGRYYSAAAQRLPPFLREPVRMTGVSCWCLRAFEAGELHAGNVDVMECSRLRAAMRGPERTQTHGLRYHATIPLYFGNRPLGVMNVAAAKWRKLTRRELDLLSTIASQVGVAIERARLAAASIDAARADERTRLARDLHDTLAQRLTAIALHVENAIDTLPDGDDGTRPALLRALELSRGGVDDTRQSMRDLRSSTRASVPEAIEALAHAFTAETGIRVRLALESPALAVNEERELLHIISEALTNVRKHAQASDVHLRLSSSANRMRLTIADNGRGFNRRRRVSGLGLLGMRERAQTLGGTLRLTSGPRQGTRIALSIPQRSGRP